MTDRSAAKDAFLAGIGWQAARTSVLAGDASARRYERLALGDRSAILMDSPPGLADDPADFVKISQHLRQIGLTAPEVYFADLEDGFLLLEDFGDATFARTFVGKPDSEGALYALACDVLVRLQAAPAPVGLTNLSAEGWADAAMMAVEWYRFALTGDRADPSPLRAVLAEVLQRLADGPRVLILRDYHAENLMWLPDRSGLGQAGILDFQLAQMGQPGYDLVSLLQDARRDVATTTEAEVIARFCAATETDLSLFQQSYAALGVQRALRILGIFTRLCLVGGKPAYVRLIPRVWSHLHRNLQTLDLAPLSKMCQSLLPEPHPAALDMICRQCAPHPLP